MEFLYNMEQRVKHAPVIKKLGVVSPGMEQTPVIFNGELLLVESAVEKVGEKGNVPYIRVRNPQTGKTYKSFGHGFYFASGYTEDGVVYAFGTPGQDDKPLTMYVTNDSSVWHEPRGGSEIRMFWSTDLENWNEKAVLTRTDRGHWNTSVCKGKDGYVMAIEVRQLGDELDPAIGFPFTCFFAASKDLMNWEFMPDECCYTKERYNACPALRYFDEWYYMICLEALPAGRYAPYIYRTKNFIDWEVGFHNPIMMWNDEDRNVRPGTPYVFTAQELDLMENRININNSDLDLCEFEGKTYIFYGSGNQMDYGFLCEAVYDGPLDSFCKAFFE